MDIIYWILTLWVVVGLIVAIAFGFSSDKGHDNDSVSGAA